MRVPVNSFKFYSCERSTQAEDLTRLLGQRASDPPSGPQRLRRGLLGYLSLFATHAFVTERQSRAGKPPSPPVFFQISAHFTATPGVPLASPAL